MKTSYVKDGIVTCAACGATTPHDTNTSEMQCAVCHTLTSVVSEVDSAEEEIWVTEAGDKIPVGEMSDIHLRNTLRMLIRQIRLGKQVSLNYHRDSLNDGERLPDPKSMPGPSPTW